MLFFNAIQGVLSIIIIIGTGYFLSAKGWFDDKSKNLISKLVVNIALPSYMVSNLLSIYSKEKLLSLGKGVLIPYITMGASLLIGILVAMLIKVPNNRKGIFISMFALSNTIFVGLPVNLALFGDESVPFVLLYYIANTTLFWTVGTHFISGDGGKKKQGFFSPENLKRIFSPPLNGFIVSIILILLGVQLPKFLMDTFKYLGNLTTPLSMIFIGIIMHSVKLRDIKFEKSTVWVLLGRFLITPFLLVLIIRYLPFPLLMKKVFFIQAAMPVMTQTPIIAKSYGADHEYAAVVTTLTTIISMVAIPLLMILLSLPGVF